MKTQSMRSREGALGGGSQLETKGGATEGRRHPSHAGGTVGATAGDGAPVSSGSAGRASAMEAAHAS